MFSAAITWATTRRVLSQLGRDRQTVVMIVGLPTLELTLLRFVLDGEPALYDQWAVPMLGVFPLITMFLVTSVAMLRERTTGTLERLLTTPVHKLDLLGGYAAAFALAAVAEAGVTAGIAYGLLGVDSRGSAWLVLLIAAANALLGMALGLFTSAFARTEFQAVQFMPAIVVPQFLLCGLVWPRSHMAGFLEAISRAMPMTYAVDALREVAARPDISDTVWWNLSAVAAAAIIALVLGAATLPRRTP